MDTKLSMAPLFQHWCCGPQLCVRSKVHSAIEFLVLRWNGRSVEAAPPGHDWAKAPLSPTGWSSKPRTPLMVPKKWSKERFSIMRKTTCSTAPRSLPAAFTVDARRTVSAPEVLRPPMAASPTAAAPPIPPASTCLRLMRESVIVPPELCRRQSGHGLNECLARAYPLELF